MWLIGRSWWSGSLNPCRPAVDQTSMSTPGVFHPSPTFVRPDLIKLDAAEPNVVAVTHDRDLVIRAAEPLLRRLVPER
jgi:hypothetical protein